MILVSEGIKYQGKKYLKIHFEKQSAFYKFVLLS